MKATAEHGDYRHCAAVPRELRLDKRARSACSAVNGALVASQ